MDLSLSMVLGGQQLVAGANQAPVGDPLLLGEIPLGSDLVISSAQLLSGVTDPDGDTLTVTDVTAVSGGTVTGTGPWTVTPSASGEGSATATISDGNGGELQRSLLWECVVVAPPVEYSRLMDYQGIHRPRIGSVGSYITVPTYAYTANTDTVIIETGAICYSDEPYAAGTVENSTLIRGAGLATRDNLIRTPTGEVRISSTTSGTSVLLAAAGTWPLNEAVRFRLTFSPTTISLEKMDSAGVYQAADSISRGSFSTFIPGWLLGANRGFHGTIFYLSAVLNGVTQYDFRFDEMAWITLSSAHNPSITASRVGTALTWKDETPESLAPQPDLTVTGTLSHGSTLTITTSTLTFAGGMPEQYLYDDMSGRSGNVLTAATIGSFNSINVSTAVTQTYKTGGPGGRPYVVRYDGPTGERLARYWNPTVPFKQVFYSRLLRVPTGSAWPGDRNAAGGTWPTPNVIPSDSTWKDGWALHADDQGGSGSDICMGTHSGGYFWSQLGNTTGLEGGVNSPGRFDLNDVALFGEWMHVDNFCRHNDAEPTKGRHVINYCNSKAKNAQSVAEGSVLSEARGFNLFQLFIDGAYIDTNPLCRVEAAEIYIAVGANAACRVVIGNAPRWENCTKKATCPPLSWAAQTITARCGLGTMNPATETLYAYVVPDNATPLSVFGKKLN